MNQYKGDLRVHVEKEENEMLADLGSVVQQIPPCKHSGKKAVQYRGHRSHCSDTGCHGMKAASIRRTRRKDCMYECFEQVEDCVQD